MYNDYNDGVLCMTNLSHFNKAQKIYWIKRLLNNKETVPFEYLSQFIKMDLQDYLKCNVEPIALPPDLPKFYNIVLSAWFSIKTEPKTTDEYKEKFYGITNI